MKEFIKDLLPRIRKYSERLDNLALLTDHPWVEVSDTGDRTLYVFRSDNNELLISRNGEVSTCTWEYLEYANALLIEVDGQRRLYKQGFVDPAVVVLRLDGQEDFLMLANENKIDEPEPRRVQGWLENKYLPASHPSPGGHEKEQAVSDSESESDEKPTWMGQPSAAKSEAQGEPDDKQGAQWIAPAAFIFLFLVGIGYALTQANGEEEVYPPREPLYIHFRGEDVSPRDTLNSSWSEWTIKRRIRDIERIGDFGLYDFEEYGELRWQAVHRADPGSSESAFTVYGNGTGLEFHGPTSDSVISQMERWIERRDDTSEEKGF